MLTHRKALKWSGGIFLGAVLLVLIATSNQPTQETRVDNSVEDGLEAGYANIGIVDEITLDVIRMEAFAAGRDGDSLYQTSGPVAVVMLPIGNLNFHNMKIVLPLICDVTVGKDPFYWSDFTEIRFINRHLRSGVSFHNLQESCDLVATTDGDGSLGVVYILAGAWDTEIPWKMGQNQKVIGYGRYK